MFLIDVSGKHRYRWRVLAYKVDLTSDAPEDSPSFLYGGHVYSLNHYIDFFLHPAPDEINAAFGTGGATRGELIDSPDDP